MSLSLDEAISMVAAPGSPFATEEVPVGAGVVRRFVNAPPTLKSFFDGARGIDETFLVYEDEEWSFAKVMDEADALAFALVHTYQVKVGDRVGIAMRNLPEWIVSFAAILSVGAVSVSLNAWWTEDEMDYAINDAGLSLLIADPERIARATGPCQRAGVPILGVRLDDLQPLEHGVDRWKDVLVPGSPMPVVEFGPDADATILYTSGTTGFPKGAVSTHRAISNAIMAFASNGAVQAARRADADPAAAANPVGVAGPQCFILIVPLFHVTGCIPVMMSCFCWHMKLVMMYRWDPERALQLIERHKVTTFVGVPTQSWDLLESPNFAKYDTSSLIAVGGGGAPAPPKLVARVETSFKKGRPTIGYGMTETNAYGPGHSGDDYVSHPTSTGHTPTIVMDVEIRDDDNRVLAPEEHGEIWMRSPTLIRGYWNKPEATAETIQDGWLRSGDVGRIDADGFLYVEDRAKDMVLRAGENVYSAEVEAALYDHPAVLEAAVFGVPHERLGEEVAAVVVLRPGEEVDADALRAHVATRIAAFKVPTLIAFSKDPLPRNPAGKFLKRELRKEFFS